MFPRSGVTRSLLFAAFTLGLAGVGEAAQPLYTVSTFAKGSDIAASNPMGITFDGTNIWVSYANSAAQDGSSGSSTVAEYDATGNLLNTYVVPGYVEGLRWDSTSKVVWALQNPGGNPSVTTIKPGTGPGAPVAFAVEDPARGYANVVFVGASIYLSYAHPVNPADATLQKVLSPKPPLGVATTLVMNATGTNIASGATNQPTLQNDPHCLRSTPTKNQIVMSSSKDGQLIFVQNVGSQTQTVSFLNVLNAIGSNVIGVNDVIYNSKASGAFFVAVVGSNQIIKVTATGLTANSLYGTIGSLTAFAQIDPVTGYALPIITNLIKPTGMVFVGN